MAKPKIVYACQSCGYQSPRWLGRCPDCHEWNSLVEERLEPSRARMTPASGEEPAPLAAVANEEEKRIRSGIGELDRVLGGGLVPGSVTLIGGDPGIGKSTLLLQAADALSRSLSCLYVSGEESARQIRMRAERLGALSSRLLVVSETSLERILEHIQKARPEVLILDSVQTVFSSSLPSAPGSIGQVRECAAAIIALAKKNAIAAFLVGHVTKDGALAGPRTLEHMVDTVLYFEGESGQQFRVLRAVKNRFGSTNEIGVFDMKEGGLAEIANPSELFLSERPLHAPGSAVLCSMEGTRPLLVEIQALVTPSFLAVPRRTTIGVDPARVALLVAVLEKKMALKLFQQDIFVNVAGGVRIEEPAVDLAVIAAVASSHEEKALEPRTVFFGEVGLAGEVRGVSQAEARIREAAKLGFDRCVLPFSNSRHLKGTENPRLVGIRTLKELWEEIF